MALTTFLLGLFAIFAFVYVMGSQKQCPQFVKVTSQPSLSGWYKRMPKRLNGTLFYTSPTSVNLFKKWDNVSAWHLGDALKQTSLISSIGAADLSAPWECSWPEGTRVTCQ